MNEPITGFEDIAPAQHEFGRTHYFRTHKLAKYTFAYRNFLYRTGAVTALEEETFLVYMLAFITPDDADELRDGEGIKKFRKLAGEWADKEGICDGEPYRELKRVALAILKPVADAEAIEPAPTKGQRAEGNG
jgi:hypothetical protein